MNGGQLNIGRQTRTETVYIHAADIRLFGFQEKLMSVTVTKAVNLVFDTRTVARSLSMNTSAKHRTILEAATQNIVSFQVRARNPTHAIITNKLIGRIAPKIFRIATRHRIRQMPVTHRPRSIVAALDIAFIKVNGIGIQAARRTGL